MIELRLDGVTVYDGDVDGYVRRLAATTMEVDPERLDLSDLLYTDDPTNGAVVVTGTVRCGSDA